MACAAVVRTGTTEVLVSRWPYDDDDDDDDDEGEEEKEANDDNEGAGEWDATGTAAVDSVLIMEGSATDASCVGRGAGVAAGVACGVGAGSMDCDAAEASCENSGIVAASPARPLSFLPLVPPLMTLAFVFLPPFLPLAALGTGFSYFVDHRSTWR